MTVQGNFLALLVKDNFRLINNFNTVSEKFRILNFGGYFKKFIKFWITCGHCKGDITGAC